MTSPHEPTLEELDQEVKAYVDWMETYFRDHGATDADDMAYLQRFRENPSPVIMHELPETWFDWWLRRKYPNRPSLDRDWHRYYRRNRPHILPNSQVGCFQCVKIFESEQIETYVDVNNDGEPTTAQCPYCFNLSVIPGRDRFPITHEILQDMHDFWLNGPYKLDS
jgi:hypothetical protein